MPAEVAGRGRAVLPRRPADPSGQRILFGHGRLLDQEDAAWEIVLSLAEEIS
jgi:hypothetical protein